MDQQGITIVQLRGTEAQEFAIPEGTPGGFSVQWLNHDLAQGPIVHVMQLKPGAHIPAHYHNQAVETFYVLDGEFINAGTTYSSGSYFVVPIGTVHGPHDTVTGCHLMVFQSVEVTPGDFHIVE